jgi:hypothetical protein
VQVSTPLIFSTYLQLVAFGKEEKTEEFVATPGPMTIVVAHHICRVVPSKG